MMKCAICELAEAIADMRRRGEVERRLQRLEASAERFERMVETMNDYLPKENKRHETPRRKN